MLLSHNLISSTYPYLFIINSYFLPIARENVILILTIYKCEVFKMIRANITQNDYFKNIDSKIALCMQKAKEFDENTPCGKYDLTDDVYVNVMTYEPKPLEELTIETHRKYADIQLILDGKEYMGYAPLENLTPSTEYDAAKDICFWKGNVALLATKKGDWTLFLPDEPHAPSLSIDGGTVKKAVFKIKYAD